MRAAAGGLVLAVVVAFFACTKGPGRPNIVLVVSDALRKDHLSIYGYHRQTSPHLEEFASAARVFDSAYAPSPYTWASVASLLTSTYPREHGVIESTQVLGAQRTTLPEVLQQNGYHTMAVVENPVLREPEQGYSQGFESWQVDLARMRPGGVANDTGDKKLGELIQKGDKPFFLYWHAIDPHAPYLAPPEHRLFCSQNRPEPSPRYDPPQTAEALQALIDCYDEEVHYFDHRFAKLLRRLEEQGLAANTIVVVVSDHGEGFLERPNLIHHSYGVYGELINVPLLIRWPRDFPAGRDGGLVSLLDLMPTLLDLAGVEKEGLGLAGVSLLSPERPAVVVSEKLRRTFTPAQRTVLTKDWKFIHTLDDDSYRLFNRGIDPLDSEPQVPPNPAVTGPLKQALRNYLERTPEGHAEDRPLGSEEIRRLKSLGYI